MFGGHRWLRIFWTYLGELHQKEWSLIQTVSPTFPRLCYEQRFLRHFYNRNIEPVEEIKGKNIISGGGGPTDLVQVAKDKAQKVTSVPFLASSKIFPRKFVHSSNLLGNSFAPLLIPPSLTSVPWVILLKVSQRRRWCFSRHKSQWFWAIMWWFTEPHCRPYKKLLL